MSISGDYLQHAYGLGAEQLLPPLLRLLPQQTDISQFYTDISQFYTDISQLYTDISHRGGGSNGSFGGFDSSDAGKYLGDWRQDFIPSLLLVS